MGWPKGKPRGSRKTTKSVSEKSDDFVKLDKQVEKGEADLSKPIDRLGVLKLDAEHLADKMGHDLLEWSDQQGSWATSECLTCKGSVAVAVHPPPGSPNINGDSILKIRCAARK